jgi:hypothetical protein
MQVKTLAGSITMIDVVSKKVVLKKIPDCPLPGASPPRRL